VFESSWQPLADAITVNALGGRDYARVRLFTSLGFAVAAIASGVVYDAVGYGPAPALFAVAAAAMAVSAVFLPDVERADLAAHRRRASSGQARPGASRAFRLGSTGVAFRVAPRLGLVLLASVLLHVGIISGFTFLPLRIEDLGGSPADVALSAGLSATAEIPAMLALGVVARRVGLRTVFALAALVYGACLASWMVIEVPLVIVATRVVTGVAFSGVIIGVVLTIAAILPRDLQGTGQALFQTSAFGLGAIVANVLGGVLYESFGHATLFGLGAALAVAAAVIGWIAFPRAGERASAPPPGGTPGAERSQAMVGGDDR
jgi:PPP family 3-phenylpropionic acid transporter